MYIVFQSIMTAALFIRGVSSSLQSSVSYQTSHHLLTSSSSFLRRSRYTLAFTTGLSSTSSKGYRRKRQSTNKYVPTIATSYPPSINSFHTSTSSSSSLHATNKRTITPTSSNNKETGVIPITLLSGFLGSGKTTTLKHLLENNSNIKIGTIVNDVASVNIDAKLINSSNNGNGIDSFNAGDGVVELQNGCACCSLADELMTSILTLTKNGERQLDAIVVELSGVADPMAVRDNWNQAMFQGHPATKLASLDRTVTLIDACTFGTDWMSWDIAGDRDKWTEQGDDCATVRKVPELLAEQVEAADLLIVNKIDLAGEKQVNVASSVARGLNDKASVLEVEFGKVNPIDLLGKMLDSEVEEKTKEEDGHSHDHDHECSKPDCTDSSHSHDHNHETSESKCAEPDCTDTSHSHDHKHDESDCKDGPGCTDTSHSHSHDHASEECNDSDCTDTTHSHTHEHKSKATKTAADQLGITSFVYRSSTPFNSQRLLTLLNQWPVPIKDDLDFSLVQGLGNKEGNLSEETMEQNRAFVGVLRSKGFCWMSPTNWSNTPGNDVWRHDTAMYWSHAGKHFGISSAGKWWGSLGAKDRMKPYFENNMAEYDRILREDWVSEEWGDRRQELVFIGSNLDEADIRKALDDCLCTEDEMVVYRSQLRNYMDSTLSVEQGGGPSLFDVGGTDHLDQ